MGGTGGLSWVSSVGDKGSFDYQHQYSGQQQYYDEAHKPHHVEDPVGGGLLGWWWSWWR